VICGDGGFVHGGRNSPLTMGNTATRFRAEARRNQWRLGALAGLVLVAILLHTTAEAGHPRQSIECCQSMVTAGGGSALLSVDSLPQLHLAGALVFLRAPAVWPVFSSRMLSPPTPVLATLLI